MATAAPRVEQLLREAHAEYAVLQVARQRLLTRGLYPNDLPDERALMAVALLLDHARPSVLETIRDHWDDMHARGLVIEDSPEAVSTPLLRLLSYVVGHTDPIEPLNDALGVKHAPSPPSDMFRCASNLEGVYWGQGLCVQFAAVGISALRITSDDEFDMEPVLLRAVDEQVSGELELSADTGHIYFTMSTTSGGVYQHQLIIKTAKTLEELV